MQSNCFKWRLISLLPQCLRLIANRESRIDFNRSQERKRDRERGKEMLKKMIYNNKGKRSPDMSVKRWRCRCLCACRCGGWRWRTLSRRMRHKHLWVCGISPFYFLYFSTRLCKKGSAWGRKTLKAKKNEACIKLVRRFLWKKPKAKRAKQAQGQRERGDDTTRIVTSRAALWHAFDGLTCGPRFPDPSSRYAVTGTRYPHRSLGYFRFHFQTQMHLRVADKVQVRAQLRPPRCSLALANSNPVNVIVVAAFIVVVLLWV